MKFKKTQFLLIAALFSNAAYGQEIKPITIDVVPGARQSFAGFGVSTGNWGGEYQALPRARQQELSRLLWHDLNVQIFRMWLNTYEFRPHAGAHDLSQFRKNYVDSGLIADAKAEGVTTLLLAPDGLPDDMKEKNAEGSWQFKTGSEADYAKLLAEFIQLLHQETGVLLDATGVQNEPNNNERFSPQQIVEVVKNLRRELDARGLQSVKIIAPEQASVDAVMLEQTDALKADANAWQVLAGISSHSYNMAATEPIAERIAAPDGSNLKEYWMTEASDNGSEEAGNAMRAASLASRFLNDMNHRVTHWIHFIGLEVSDPKDNATRIIAYEAQTGKAQIFTKYWYYQQLNQTFGVGAKFRDSQSSLDGDMTWTYGVKPHLTAAAAQNADGSWGIGLVNFTADSFAGLQGWADEKWNREQNGHTPAQTFRVTLRVPELKNRAAVKFTVQRSDAMKKNASSGEVTMQNGAVELNIAPLELVTLREVTAKKGTK